MKAPVFRVVLTAASISCALAATANAATYNSQSAFTAALSSGYYLENYQSSALNGHSTPWNFAGGAGNAVTYRASTPTQAFLVFDLSGNHYLTTAGDFTTQWSGPITFTFTGAPVNAIGGSFFLTSAGGAVVGGDVHVVLSDGTNINLTNQTNSTFWGYIGASPITSLVLTPDATHHFTSVDNFIVGAAPIPEPASAALLLTGAIAATFRRRLTNHGPKPASGR